MNGNFLGDIRKMAEEVSAKEGCFLYDIEFVGTGGNRALRVYIDKDLSGGASIDDCSNVSRGLNLLLDAIEEEIPGGNYSLEVSTPGLERVLKESRHFERAVGKKISVKTFAPLVDFNSHLPELGKAKQIQGILLSFDEKSLTLAYGDGAAADDSMDDGSGDGGGEVSPEPRLTVTVPLESVTKAHMVFEFNDSSAGKKPGGKPGKKAGGSSNKKKKKK